MGGFFGVVSKTSCANTLFYGTDYHSHMGNKRAGMATMNEQGIIKRTIHNIENSYFRNKFEDELSEFIGNRGVGVISDRDPQPIVLRSHLGTFAIVTVGKINNLEELGAELLEKGINFSELSTGQVNATELVAHLITLGQTFAEGIRLVQDKVRGSCSMLILTQDGIIAARDKYGRTPIAVGIRCSKHSHVATSASGVDADLPRRGEQSAAQTGEQQATQRRDQPTGQSTVQAAMRQAVQSSEQQSGEKLIAGGAELMAVAFASESCSFPNQDFQLVGFLGPGEAVLVQESPSFCSVLEGQRPFFVEEPQALALKEKEIPVLEGENVQALEGEKIPALEEKKISALEGKDAWRSISEFHQILPPREKMQICSFLWVYFGFPTSAYEGINVEEVRFRNGVLVGKEDDVEVDAVCSIPDSGTGMAMGYAVGKAVPYRQAVAKYTPTWPRSFTPNDKERRRLVAKMKLLPNPDVLRGAKMVCCDDSIVRGTQLKNNVQVLFRNGVKEIHARISCPPIINSCPYLSFTSTRSEMELVTRRVIYKLQQEGKVIAQQQQQQLQTQSAAQQQQQLQTQSAAQQQQLQAQSAAQLAAQSDDLKPFINEDSKEHQAMIQGICDEMGFTTLKYSSIENLIHSIGLPKEDLCTYCFDGVGCGE